jgi:eukaryotic-like serine/threonine-protein kinase
MPVESAPVRLPDRYRDPLLVALGGMGQVYRATDTALDRIVAIKLLDDRYASDVTIRKRFTREALAAARLSSDPSTITIFDVGECDGRPFIVMEYLPGGSLEDVLKKGGAQPPSRALEWLEQAAQALDHAHERSVVHRDVKPANLLLTGDGRVRVADFGVASAAGLESFTQTGTVIGTAGYLSPEQADGQAATPASDRYGLGVVAFELLTGSRPFESSSPAAEAVAHLRSPVPSISACRPGTPPEADAVFARALAKDPARRFSTSGEFVAALRAAFADAAGPTRIVSPQPKVGAPSTDAAPKTRILAGPQPRRTRLLLPLALVLLLTGGVLAAVLLAGRGSSSHADRNARVTVTEKGTTVLRTVTEQASAPPSTAAATTPSKSRVSGSSFALQGYGKMQAGDYAGAMPLLEQAANDLKGSGSLAEAYNDYNLALSLAKTQGCSPRVMQLLEASQAIQGPRKPIRDLRKACEKSRFGPDQARSRTERAREKASQPE